MLAALGGVDSGREPSLIDPNQLAWASNVQCRGGFPATRPRLTSKALVFSTTEIETWFLNHRYQGNEIYYSPNGLSYDIVSIGGRIFSIDIAGGFIVQEVTPTASTATTINFNAPAVSASVAITVADGSKIWAGYPIHVNGQLYTVDSVVGNVVTATNVTDTPAAVIAAPAAVIYLDPNIPHQPIAWLEQAEQYMIIQNGKDGAIIFDGAKSRRATITEVPTGTAMVYNEEIGRLCVGLINNEIAIGDVVGGPTSILSFTETDYLAEGGRFRVPLEFGPITAMTMLANLDRSNGQGPMIVSAKRGWSTFNLPPTRSAWKQVTYPLQVNMPLKFSATSQASVVIVNGDAFYRAHDGLRSFVFAIREFNGLGNVPVSNEMDRAISRDDDALLNHASGMLFNNRLLFTLSPGPNSNGIYHRSLGSLDFNLISRMGAKAPPAYDGIWTGLRVTGMFSGSFSGQERAFLWALDPDYNTNKLWELHKESGKDDNNRVQSVIELRTFTCGKPLELKQGEALEVWIDRVVGQVNFTVQYRPDSYPCWFDWGTFQVCVTDQLCNAEGCTPLQVYNAGYKTRFGFGQPPNVDESLDSKPSRNAYEHQIRIAWTGHCRIRKVLFKANVIEESVSVAV